MDESILYVFQGESASKKVKVGLSANKVMTVLWDIRDTIQIDYLQQGKTVSGEYYVHILDRFKDNVKKIRPHLPKKEVLLHQGNARALNFKN